MPLLCTNFMCVSGLGNPQQEVKEARDAANFHAKAAWRNGIVGKATANAILMNNLNMQRAVNRCAPLGLPSPASPY